nr:hypothetical protein [Tanacetum cinerariifolium]
SVPGDGRECSDAAAYDVWAASGGVTPLLDGSPIDIELDGGHAVGLAEHLDRGRGDAVQSVALPLSGPDQCALGVVQVFADRTARRVKVGQRVRALERASCSLVLRIAQPVLLGFADRSAFGVEDDTGDLAKHSRGVIDVFELHPDGASLAIAGPVFERSPVVHAIGRSTSGFIAAVIGRDRQRDTAQGVVGIAGDDAGVVALAGQTACAQVPRAALSGAHPVGSLEPGEGDMGDQLFLGQLTTLGLIPRGLAAHHDKRSSALEFRCQRR